MVVLLITGAIDISAYQIPSTSITDTESRLSQYTDSILYAFENYKKITHIVFCENTNFQYDYSDLKNKALLNGKNFEVLSFSGNYREIQLKGKGYGEGEIIDYALNNSQIIKKCQFFYKLTGRLKITNMDEIVKCTVTTNTFDFHSGRLYNRTKDHIDTIFYKTHKDFYTTYLRKVYLDVEENNFIYLEHLFYEQLKNFNLLSFRVFPRISGQSGTSGQKYDKGLSNIILEKFYYKTGIHSLGKNYAEKCIFRIILMLLSVWRMLK